MKYMHRSIAAACILSMLAGSIAFTAAAAPNTVSAPTAAPVTSSAVPNIGYSSIPTTIQRIMMNVSFNKKTPLQMKDLSYVKVRYIGFDNKTHTGELIIHKKLAKDVFDIFEELYSKRYPIEKIQLIDQYKGSDDLSMKANNTSAFNTRVIAGKKSLSNHSYGIAIDINPLQNPHVSRNKVSPTSAKAYANRTVARKGMIIKGDACYTAFKKRGWSWGGEWKSSKDYQHFEKKIK
ncbi:M15 family metallopeptidase [Aneurinibacillus sp. REN35]|uniref:M15 family metallopeptidase n=1 Tax=Aneurinibacillus sp. REN35 TaxID=3237286 RepID=UPI00352985AD